LRFQRIAVTKIPSIGGSDCHSKEQVGRAFTLFKNPVGIMEELVEEIMWGNCKGVTQRAKSRRQEGIRAKLIFTPDGLWKVY